MDPAKHLDETQSLIVMNSYDPLFYPEPMARPPRPFLATDWKVSPDGKTYTFTLRKGVLFHDGTEMTADDVVYSIDRMLKIGMGYAWLWKGIIEPGTTKAVDKYTVEFKLTMPYGPFLSTLVQLFVVNSKLLKANEVKGDMGQEYLTKHDAGSGPYYIERYEPGEIIVFRKFEKYWRGWKPGQIDKVIMKYAGEHATLVANLKAGLIDMTEQWLSAKVFEELKKTPGIIVQEDPNIQLFFVSLHNQKPPTDCVWVRRAISWAFDYDTAIKEIFPGAAQARGPVPILLPGHNDKVFMYRQDFEKAKECLAKSKYTAKELAGFTIECVYVKGLESEERIGLLLRDNLAKIGLKMELIPETWARMVDMAKRKATTPHMLQIFHTAKYPSPDSHTHLMYYPKPDGEGTFIAPSWYYNPKVTELLEKARVAPDVEEQYRLYGKVQEIVVDEAATLFVANPLHRIPHRDWVKGYIFLGILGFDLVWYNYVIVK